VHYGGDTEYWRAYLTEYWRAYLTKYKEAHPNRTKSNKKNSYVGFDSIDFREDFGFMDPPET